MLGSIRALNYELTAHLLETSSMLRLDGTGRRCFRASVRYQPRIEGQTGGSDEQIARPGRRYGVWRGTPLAWLAGCARAPTPPYAPPPPRRCGPVSGYPAGGYPNSQINSVSYIDIQPTRTT
eukprot:3716428-Pleurochrysis_carterae.AAC.1